MGKQDLQLSLTIDHDSTGKASHCNTFFYVAQCSSIQDDHIMLGKDAKGKGKTHAKRVEGGKCSAEEHDVKESMDKPRAFVAFSKVFFLCLTKWSFSFFFGPFFFSFLYQGLFSAFDFFKGVIVKNFHVGIFVKCVM